jgi:hypothetical protein
MPFFSKALPEGTGKELFLVPRESGWRELLPRERIAFVFQESAQIASPCARVRAGTNMSKRNCERNRFLGMPDITD